ncbi:type II secretion system F family protein [Phycicoccus sp. CSK15P-2]|uniref:type II secretion system F family protein n=1 Tax=Phycicoccus sp. CSK15P-2 TaxID=2807627 RepID=UPI00194FDAFC|nr:type II secretion system F family protein [Phycicoccus sp. CSK15P-2]MBM6405983.1 type II secretion system F family protein [Phycicoccus sp. CSK15P-2]
MATSLIAALRARSSSVLSVVASTVVALALPVLGAPAAVGAEAVPTTLSDVRVRDSSVEATVVLRSSDKTLTVDPSSVTATLGGKPAKVSLTPAEATSRSTMLVIDTSGSMGTSGMATVREAVKQFVAAVPEDVKVGVVSFASTSGVDVEPTTDRAAVRASVAGLRAQGETSLYKAIQDAVKALGTEGERSIVLLSDGGDTVAAIEGGSAKEKSERKKALDALAKAKVRAEVVSFNTPEADGGVLDQLASTGGGSVAKAGDSKAVAAAFGAAARALESQVHISVDRPAGVSGDAELVVSGAASGESFSTTSPLDLGDTAPVEVEPVAAPAQQSAFPDIAAPISALAPKLLVPAIVTLFLGVFLLALALINPSFRTRRSERISAVEAYGLGAPRAQKAQTANAAALSESIVNMGEQFMEGRESTTKTMELLTRADLPWRAGEWLVLRMIAVVVGAALGFLFGGVWVLLVGALVGFILPPFALRFMAKRRGRKFEEVLPDVMMLVATSLASGFSLLQALDSVAKDAPEPASKEFSRALAEARIGADVSDALDSMAVRMDSRNMHWTTMAIRIQREVGGNLAETLRTTAGTLREREMLRRQVRALSAEGRLSAYVLVALPIGLFLFSLKANYEYVSLLWTTTLGIGMSVAGIVSMTIGIFWMRKVVTIEV